MSEHRRSAVSPMGRVWHRTNIPAGIASMFWLVLIIVPIYFMVITSLRRQDDYLTDGPVAPPEQFTLENFSYLREIGFGQVIWNSVVVTGFTILLVVATALPAAYAIVRNRSRSVQTVFTLVLFGFAIPAQAVIVPIYWIITRLELYDSLIAIVLPTAAFAIPISVIVLTSTLRDIPKDLYEAMMVDGAGTVRTFARLVVPMSRPGLITIAIFSGLSAWNGFLFPLVLTQSAGRRVIPLELYNFQTQSGINVPGLMAAVVISALPVLALYLFGRRQLLSGLAAGYSK